MKKYRLFLKLFLLVFVFSAFQTVVFAKDDWLSVQSKNFFLIGNASEKDIRRVATKLEQFREVFTKLFPKLRFNSPIPTTVIVFKSGKAFRPYKPVRADGKTDDWTAGYFQPGEDGNYITLSTEGERQQTYSIIFHEYVHYLVNNNLGRSKVPPWFNEGIAEYYDQFMIENDQKVTLGGLNSNHLYLLQKSRLIPFDTFFNIDYYSLHQQGSHSKNIFYAQAWALMHYLMQGNEGRRNPQLSAFLDLLLKGNKPREAFQEAFQTDYATMEAELKKYVEQRSFRVSVITFEKKLLFDSEMQTSRMTEGQAKAYLGDLLYRSNRLDEAEAHLLEALKANGESGLANTAMGLVKMRQNKFAEARKYIEKAVAADAKNHIVHYQYAYILSREGMDSGSFVRNYTDETAAKMRQALSRSITINPGFPESYRLLAFINLVRNENLDEGIALMNKALNLAPGNQFYQLNLADFYVRKNDFEKAQSIIESVYQTADEPNLRSIAENLLSRLQNYRQQIEMVKKRGGFEDSDGNPPRLIVRTDDGDLTDESELTEEEIAEIEAEAVNEGINQSLRKPGEGEKRVQGYLSKIECPAGTIVFTIKAGNQTLRLQSKDFRSLMLITFVPADNLEFGCNSIKKDLYAVITYMPAQNPKSKTAGEIVAIEVVPETFQLKGEN